MRTLHSLYSSSNFRIVGSRRESRVAGEKRGLGDYSPICVVVRRYNNFVCVPQIVRPTEFEPSFLRQYFLVCVPLVVRPIG